MIRARNRYSRARIRARVRRPKRRGGARWYYGVLSLIVIAGLAGIAASAGSDDTPPLAGINPATQTFYDHWHAALGVNVCGEWLGAPVEFHEVAGRAVQAGLHTHGDGFIHIHPYSSADAGDNATLGRYFENGGWELSASSLSVWSGPATDPAERTWSNGDECPAGSTMAGRRGVVKWSIDCVDRTGNPADYKLEDLTVIALAFVPKGEDIGVPPNAFEAPEADAGDDTPQALNVRSCSTAGPGGELPTTTPTTAPVPATPGRRSCSSAARARACAR
jgi:hypothetical protein